MPEQLDSRSSVLCRVADWIPPALPAASAPGWRWEPVTSGALGGYSQNLITCWLWLCLGPGWRSGFCFPLSTVLHLEFSSWLPAYLCFPLLIDNGLLGRVALGWRLQMLTSTFLPSCVNGWCLCLADWPQNSPSKVLADLSAVWLCGA